MEHNSRPDQIAELLLTIVGLCLFATMTVVFLDMLTAPTGSARESMFLSFMLIILTGCSTTVTLILSYALRMCISREIQHFRDKVGTRRSIR